MQINVPEWIVAFANGEDCYLPDIGKQANRMPSHDAGSLPELMADLELALSGEPPYKIDPLR